MGTSADVDPDAKPASAGEGLDDVTLVMRARDGDMAAYEQLVRRYQGPMYRLAVRMLSSKADAEDVVQEVFLTAWRRLGQLQQDAALVGWLYRMTTNRCLNVIRARRPTTCRRAVKIDQNQQQRLNESAVSATVVNVGCIFHPGVLSTLREPLQLGPASICTSGVGPSRQRWREGRV